MFVWYGMVWYHTIHTLYGWYGMVPYHTCAEEAKDYVHVRGTILVWYGTIPYHNNMCSSIYDSSSKCTPVPYQTTHILSVHGVTQLMLQGKADLMYVW